jgi:hypothetical protein
MIEPELVSTVAEEISVFQRLALVNGTNPLRLAVCPVAIPLQDKFPPPVPGGVTDVFETPEQAVRKMAIPSRGTKMRTIL